MHFFAEFVRHRQFPQLRPKHVDPLHQICSVPSNHVKSVYSPPKCSRKRRILCWFQGVGENLALGRWVKNVWKAMLESHGKHRHGDMKHHHLATSPHRILSRSFLRHLVGICWRLGSFGMCWAFEFHLTIFQQFSPFDEWGCNEDSKCWDGSETYWNTPQIQGFQD